MRPTPTALAFAAATLLGTAATPAAAVILDISTQFNANPVQFLDPTPGIVNVGHTLMLAAGSYLVTPVDTFAGGAYTAALRFSSPNAPDTGYEWNYWMSVNGGPGVKHGFGEGIPAQGGSYTATAAQAFAAAPWPVGFTLASAAPVTFYWRDDIFGDNAGGISIQVSAVPEPRAVLLMLAGLGALGFVARRRRQAD